MPLRLRRGTDAERLTVVPLEGELVYTTDTKRVFVGDGTTSGGVGVSSLGGPLNNDLILNGYDVTGTGNINITGSIAAPSLNGDLKGSVFADNSTVLVDSVNGKINGDIDATSLRTSETAIALGNGTGGSNFTISIGNNAGKTNQSQSAIAIGREAGNDAQGARAVAIGFEAGNLNQGLNAVAVGYRAGFNNQNPNSIILNASGAALNSTVPGFFVNPIRNIGKTGNILQYNSSTGEITYSSNYIGNINGSVFGDDSTLLVDGINGKLYGTTVTTNEVNSESLSSLTINSYSTLNVNCTGSATAMVYTAVSSGNISGSDTPQWDFRGVKTSTSSPTPFSPGELIGSLRITGYVGGPYPYDRPSVALYGGFDASADFNDIAPASFGTIVTGANNGVFVLYNFDHQGTISTGQIKVAALDAIAKAAVTPQVGMIIYDSVAKKFQGYADDIGGPGVPGWVDLH